MSEKGDTYALFSLFERAEKLRTLLPLLRQTVGWIVVLKPAIDKQNSDSAQESAVIEKTIAQKEILTEKTTAIETTVKADNSTSSQTEKTAESKDLRDSLAQTLSAGHYHTVALKSDGTVIATENNGNGQCSVSEWRNIVTVSAGDDNTLGLKSDGTVVATTISDESSDEKQSEVSDWTNIIAVSVADNHSVGLKKDGTVVATGNNSDGQCNVDDWTNIKLPDNR